MNLSAIVTLPALSSEPSPDSNPNTGQPRATVFRGKSPVTGRSFRAIYWSERLSLDIQKAEPGWHGLNEEWVSVVDQDELHRELLGLVVWLMEPLGEHVRVEVG